MKPCLFVLFLFSLSVISLSGCTSAEKDPAKKFHPVMFEPVDIKEQENLPENVTVRFLATVGKIKNIPAKKTPPGIVIGSKYHVKREIVVHIDDVIQDRMAVVQPGELTSFSVENLNRVFGSALPELAAGASKRQYRFVMKGELNYQNEYDWVYLRGTQTSF